MKMNAITESRVIENGFCPNLINRLDQFLNYSCWEYNFIFYLQVEIQLNLNNGHNSNEKIQNTLEQMQEPFKSNWIRSSFVWTKKINFHGMTTVSFIFLVDGARVQHLDEITSVIDSHWKYQGGTSFPNEINILNSNLGRVFGHEIPAGRITTETIFQYEILANSLIDLAWYYQQPSTKGTNFGSSRVGSKRYPIPMQRQGDQVINAITGEIKQPFKNLKSWHLGDQMCIDF